MTMPIREASPHEASLSDRRESAEAWQAPDDHQSMASGATANGGSGFDLRDWLTQATGEMRESFARNRRVISFAEYVTLFSAEPARQLR